MYHTPVLLKESINNLAINPSGVYIDLTFGGGGHSIEILKNLKHDGKLVAFDIDSDSMECAKKIKNNSFHFFKSNYKYFDYFLKFLKIEKINGFILDLGVSSHQIDSPSRGFSTRFDGNLDMRMDTNLSFSAYDLINNYSIEKLQKVLLDYGEIKNHKKIAESILNKRKKSPIKTTQDLVNILHQAAPKFINHPKFFAIVFQAFRIEVNQELQNLKECLLKIPKYLSKDGRVIAISYHSLEDRIVKRFFNYGNFKLNLEKDIYGNTKKPLTSLFNKILKPSDEEIKLNPRARSAKMRVATNFSYV